MRIASVALWGLITFGSLGACSSYTSHVEEETGTLGRVVVYRNGIAYYERKAPVADGKVTLTVPADKVDDFLKSLTVADSATGKPLPIAYPTAGANNDNKVDMTIEVSEPGVNEVVLTYITEAPAWKPSYRVVIGDDDKVELQGWAIVDNTSGETWRKVKVGVGSSSALSFRFDLRSVRTVWRDTLKADERFAVAPPTGGSTRSETTATAAVLATIDQAELPAGEEQYAYTEAERRLESVATTTTGDAGSAGPRPAAVVPAPTRSPAKKPAMARAKVKELADKLNASDGEVVLETYVTGKATSDDLAAEDRGHWLRNELIREGVAPGRVKVEAKKVDAGVPFPQGVRVVQTAHPGGNPNDPNASGEPVGESHFESRSPVTVERGTSAMVAVLDDGAEGDVVYLYDAESERGNARFAFKAIRFKNPTGYTLETGPMTVYGEGRFVGEGLTEPIPPRATAIVPFALDRQIVVEKDFGSQDKITKLMTLQRGILRTEVQHQRVTKMKLTSQLADPTRVFVRHSVRKGWTLEKNPTIYERMGEAHLFEVTLAPGETKTLEIVEATPMVRALDLRSPDGVQLVRVFLEGADIDKTFAEPMRKLLSIYTEMADIQQTMEVVRSRLGEYRVRMDELQNQILTLKGVPNAGALMAHLQAKMKEMSNGVQNGTIEIVNLEQKLMLARIRFQDGVSELRLEASTPTTAPKTTALTPG
ncbi:MAG: hypothetical protein IT385_25300 [Deltaproteobacteria bacterium]|nr:hypothetical protein [Deltaproteobacteria bacterium]